MPEIRKQLGLTLVDFTKGTTRSKKSHEINIRAKQTEIEVGKILIGKFGKEFVHREYPFIDDRRYRADYLVYYDRGSFYIDIFYAENRRSLVGCINSKQRKYELLGAQLPEIILLQFNTLIGQRDINKFVSNKKNELQKGIIVMSMDTFLKYIEGKRTLKIIRIK